MRFPVGDRGFATYSGPMVAHDSLVAYAFPAVALGGPLLLGLWGAVRGLSSRAPASRGRRDWKLVFASAFTYALAFNLIFFIQELYLVKRKDEAVAAVPDEFCDEMALVGPVSRISERYRAWADSGITGLTITTEQPEAMELMAKLASA